MDEYIVIKKAVLHILDNNMPTPVISDKELEMDSEIGEFLENHIMKILNDNNLKKAEFIGENNKVRNMCNGLKDDTDSFLDISKDLAKMLFQIMYENVDIPPADFIFCLFDDGEDTSLAILKLNYKIGFTHYVQQFKDGSENMVIKNKTILPSEGQRIDEGVLINLKDFSIKIIEKAYSINGEKEFYLSNLFLLCSTDLSNNEKIKILDKATRKISKKYFDDDFKKVASLKKSLGERLEDADVIDVDELVEDVFKTDILAKEECITEIKKAGLPQRTISISDKLPEKKLKSQKIKTDSGIEISIPLDYYNDKEKIEFVNNVDGTISIVIKNIGKITSK
jgi:hypothetical protein